MQTYLILCIRKHRIRLWCLFSCLVLTSFLIYSYQSIVEFSKHARSTYDNSPHIWDTKGLSFVLSLSNVSSENAMIHSNVRFQSNNTGGRFDNAKIQENKSKIQNDINFYMSDLYSNLAPASIHFVWCEGKYFEFQHYLAIKRANSIIRPDKVFFHYKILPDQDDELYYDWFIRIRVELDVLLIRKLNDAVDCTTAVNKLLLVLELIERLGGIYIPEATLLVDFPVHFREASLISGVKALTPTKFKSGIIVGQKGMFNSPKTAEELLVILTRLAFDQSSVPSCCSVKHYNEASDEECMCVHVSSTIYPKDIWKDEKSLGNLSRLAAYGHSSKIFAFQDKHEIIPRIAHYVCISCSIHFDQYLSMLSAAHVAGLNTVYLHGVVESHDHWWDLLVKDKRFVYIPHDYPETKDGLVTNDEHAIGLLRTTILLKYGGVYCQDSVLWTKRIPDNHFKYQAVISPGWGSYGHWPGCINHAVLMASPNSAYVFKLRTLLQHRHSNHVTLSDRYLAYKILEELPEDLFLDEHMQVECYDGMCYPTWLPNSIPAVKRDQVAGKFDWRHDTLSIYWSQNSFQLTVEIVKYTSGLVVEVSRAILNAAHIMINQDL